MLVQIGSGKYLNLQHVQLLEVDGSQIRFFMNHAFIKNPGTARAVAQLFEIESDDFPSEELAKRFAGELVQASWTRVPPPETEYTGWQQ